MQIYTASQVYIYAGRSSSIASSSSRRGALSCSASKRCTVLRNNVYSACSVNEQVFIEVEVHVDVGMAEKSHFELINGPGSSGVRVPLHDGGKPPAVHRNDRRRQTEQKGRLRGGTRVGSRQVLADRLLKPNETGSATGRGHVRVQLQSVSDQSGIDHSTSAMGGEVESFSSRPFSIFASSCAATSAFFALFFRDSSESSTRGVCGQFLEVNDE